MNHWVIPCCLRLSYRKWICQAFREKQAVERTNSVFHTLWGFELHFSYILFQICRSLAFKSPCRLLPPDFSSWYENKTLHITLPGRFIYSLSPYPSTEHANYTGPVTVPKYITNTHAFEFCSSWCHSLSTISPPLSKHISISISSSLSIKISQLTCLPGTHYPQLPHKSAHIEYCPTPGNVIHKDYDMMGMPSSGTMPCPLQEQNYVLYAYFQNHLIYNFH